MTKQLEALIASEIADFFAGVAEIHTESGGPNTVEESQQQLTGRVTRIASDCEAAMIAALEQKEEQRANWFQMAQKLGEDMDAAEKRIAAPEATLELEREKSRRVMSQNHQLEASPLAVKLPAEINPEQARSLFSIEIDEDQASAAADGWNSCLKEIRAAGGKVEGE